MDNGKHIKLIETFYDAFAHREVETMLACYHPQVEFTDPAFGKLSAEDAGQMWRMLITNAKRLEIFYAKVRADGQTGSAQWVAKYLFSKTRRPVTNYITATFQFKDGLIYRHHDHFSLWQWSKQALGLTGLLLGWTPWMRKKIQTMTRQSLTKFNSPT